jgi:signal transduction histidine kinase
MKIIVKLTLAFLIIAFMVIVVGYFSTVASQRALEKSIGENLVSLFSVLMDQIDRVIFSNINRVRVFSQSSFVSDYIKQSNLEFEHMGDIQKYIDEKDSEWKSLSQDAADSFIEELLNKKLSFDLRNAFIEFLEKIHGFKVFAEVFVTNKYGAIVGLTNKTSDYRQDDEEWWQNAQRDGLYVEDVKYDESSKVYSIAICARIDDEKGNFIGVIKGIINIQAAKEVIDEFLEAELRKGRALPEFGLLNKNNQVIFTGEEAGGEFGIFGDYPGYIISRIKKDVPASWFFTKGDVPGEDTELFAYAKSNGFRDFKGLGWMLAGELKEEDIIAPIEQLRHKLLFFALSAMLLSVIIGFFISKSIVSSLSKLSEATDRISGGDLDTKIDIASADEIGDLANAFKKMLSNLREKQKQIQQSQEQLKKWSEALESRVQERTNELAQSQSASLNIMEDLQDSYVKLKQMQDQLIQSEKMSALGILASGVAHEVKNPLGIIIQAINYLENTVAKDKDREDVSRIVVMVKEAVTRADNIIRGLLDYSRVSTVSLKPEDINIILDNTLNLVRHSKEFERIEIVDEKSKGLPDVVVDKNKMQQVFINLITNASQAMAKDGGKLIIRSFYKKLDSVKSGVGRRAMDAFALGEQVVIVEIEDTGKGIHKDNLSKIFDPFFSTKGPREGAGLGLAVCANIIELHKGLIDVESQEGKGAKFILTFKIAKG